MILLVTRDFRRQFGAMIPGALVMFISGLWSSWGSYNPNIKLSYSITHILSEMSFYLGTIPGSMFGAYYLYRHHLLNMNHSNVSALALLSILYLSLPKNIWFLIPLRFLVGIFCGRNHLFFINYGADITTPKNRGRIIFLLQLSYCLGNFTISWIDFEIAHYVVGGLTIIFAIFGGFSGYHLLRRSPVFALYDNDFGSAAKAVYYFWGNTRLIFKKVQELKNTLEDIYNEPYKFWKSPNMKTVLIILIVLLGNSFIANPFTMAWRSALVHKEFQCRWSSSIVLGPRIMGLIIGNCLLELQSRRFWYSLSSVVISFSLIIIGILLAYTESVPLLIVTVIFLFIEFLYGFGMMALPDILCSEILPQKEKRFSMSFLHSVQAVLQLIPLVLIFMHLGKITIHVLHSIFGLLLICAAFYIYTNLQDTRTLTPFEASEKYDES